MAERVDMVETLVEEKEKEHQFMRLTAETQTHAQLARFETQLESLNGDKAMVLSVSSRLENLERDVRADLEALKVEVATLQRQVGSLANLPTEMDVNTSQVAPDAGQLGDLQHRLATIEMQLLPELSMSRLMQQRHPKSPWMLLHPWRHKR
jgi:chromosome segregation ATPase